MAAKASVQGLPQPPLSLGHCHCCHCHRQTIQNTLGARNPNPSPPYFPPFAPALTCPFPGSELNRLDNAKGARATDALLNYETVKLFANEELERANYAKASALWRAVACCACVCCAALPMLRYAAPGGMLWRRWTCVCVWGWQPLHGTCPCPGHHTLPTVMPLPCHGLFPAGHR